MSKNTQTYDTPVCEVFELIPEGVLCNSFETPDEVEFEW